MASQSQFPGSVVPGAQRDVCYAFGWSIPPPLLNFTSFFPEGLFYCAFRIFLFFALHKVLTHVANGCMLVVCLFILLV